jgi:FkbM family methyltransferase
VDNSDIPVSTRLFSIRGIGIVAGDLQSSMAMESIADELGRDDYGLSRIPFTHGDVAIDIGAHVGLTSIYLAKRFPFLNILCFEPVPMNFANLRRNLALNGVGNVHAHHMAVTADGREITLGVHPLNTGGASGFDSSTRGGALAADPATGQLGHTVFSIRSTTLDDIFQDHGLDNVRLLKIDCEGAEHEILRRTAVLPRVEYLSGEFHRNTRLEAQGHRVEDLLAYVQRILDPAKVAVSAINFAE